MKTCIVLSSIPDYLRPMLESDITVIRSLSEKGKILRILRNICFKLKFLSIDHWINKDLYSVHDYDNVIFFANKYTLRVLKYLLKKYPEKNYIIWHWNPVTKEVDPRIYPNKDNISICSFDPNDAKKFNIKYIESFSVINIERISQYELQNVIADTDIYFIGQDKGRINKIKYCKNLFKSLELRYNIKVIRDKTSKNNPTSDYSPRQSYEEVINDIRKAKAVLEILQPNQTGFSQRVFEGIVYNKKIITDNVAIESTKLYTPNRVFILGKDDVNKLREFIYNPLPEIAGDVLEYYSFHGWLKRITSIQ